MFGAALLDSLLLVIAVAGLAVTAGALACTLAPDGLARLLAAVVLGAALAVLEALVLGTVGLGGNPVVLTSAALASAAVARRGCPRPALGVLSELTAGLGRATRATRPALARAGVGAGAGALTGALAAVAAIELHRPVLGQDALTYHLPEVVGWVQSGHVGRVLKEFYGLPVGNYPVTEEVLLTWVTGISHGFSAALVLTLATVPLLLAAGWLALAELDVPCGVRVLALAALALAPLIVQAWVEPGTDLPALTWLACCGALCLAARRHPRLLAAAVVAAGLAVGTKTTVLSYSVVMLVAAAWVGRAQLRSQLPALTGAAGLAGLTGGIWYLRNWVDHGSPLWPFSSFPGGDPRPPIIRYLSASLLDSVQRTLLRHLNGYAAVVSGGVVLILAGIATVLPAVLLRRRRLLLAGLVVGAGTLEYAAGPVTGLPSHGSLLLVAVVGSTLRYLMPVFAAGALALALAGADGHPGLAAAGRLTLAGAVVWDLVTDLSHAFYLASDAWLGPAIVIGALLGPALGWALARSAAPRPGPAGHRPRPAPARPRAVAVVLAGPAIILAALILAVGATHFSARHAVTPDDAEATSHFLLTQPGYTHTDAPVATSRTGLAQLAGDRLQHPLSVIAQHISCAGVARLREHSWLMITLAPAPAVVRRLPPGVSPSGAVVGCLRRAAAVPEFDDGQYAVYPPLNA